MSITARGAAAGLQAGDITSAIGDTSARAPRFPPGMAARLRIVRGGAEQAVAVTLGKAPAP